MRPPPRKVPRATYRLQLGPHLDLPAAAGLVPYLSALGVSHLYLSPVFRARRGSTHGYDVVDHGEVDPALGGEASLRQLAARARDHGMGLILDLVPNHMCIVGDQNPWWTDVLENGRSSPHALFFDIDWSPPKPDLWEKVLIPVLGDQFGQVLERGELQVRRQGGAFYLGYYEWVFPLAPRSFGLILEPALTQLVVRAGGDSYGAQELASILTAIRYLPARHETEPHRVAERRREKEVVKRRLADLCTDWSTAAEAIDAQVAAVNGRPGEPRSFDRLDALLGEQAYRLSHWRVASDEINYRRFFDINELAALRVEVADVHAAVNRLPTALFEEEIVDGFRLDHVDGLFHPVGYLARMPAGAYVTVEKILGPGERLRADWPVDGTTGYEHLHRLDALFTDPSGQGALLDLHADMTGSRDRWPDVVYESKKLVLDVALSSELTMLARRLDRISEQHRFSRDFTLNSLQQALGEVIACFPVYRSYVTPDGVVGAEDRRSMSSAVREARRRNPALSGSIFDFIGAVLLLDHPPELDEAQRQERLDFVLRFQQITGPVAAKGTEDTAFYRYVVLASANEVGGEPGSLGLSIERFHLENAERLRTHPSGLSATATHDTKRGEDVRMRLIQLAERPRTWMDAVVRWRERNAPYRAFLEDGPAPDGLDEYLFYQALLGAWPAGAEGPDRTAAVGRIQAYLQKAAREAKRRTSWISPAPAYEAALNAFAEASLAEGSVFLDEIEAFIADVAPGAAWASACRTLLKITTPGVPDFYQGTELEDLSLVDPDNRRPVDFSALATRLEALRADARPELREADTSALKLLVTVRALGLRREQPDLFLEGEYLPLPVAGPASDHVIAFARRLGRRTAVVVASRFFSRLPVPPLGPAWDGTSVRLSEVSDGLRWHDALSGAEVDEHEGSLLLPAVLVHIPCALLVPVR